MNSPVMQHFSYDPFDPAVMADPLPYYRVLRDEHPVYYIDKWDTYALSRFADVVRVAALASKCIELVEEVHATSPDGRVEDETEKHVAKSLDETVLGCHRPDY